MHYSPDPTHIQKYIHSHAPIRICDLGGWTDTWFAGYGAVFNIAVGPGADVKVEVYTRAGDQQVIEINARNYEDKYLWHPGPPWQKHPLLEAAVASMNVPDDYDICISIHSQVPPGASTGTSAAVTVALISALDCVTPGRMTRTAVARKALEVETVWLKQQSGIQDQLCSAWGGINLIEMSDYPEAEVHQITITDKLISTLDKNLSLIYLGNTHHSSEIHEMVIDSLEKGYSSEILDELRDCSRQGAAAIQAGDLWALGEQMQRNTRAQQALHPGLISTEAHLIGETAMQKGALGWKVNGAGGRGGSVTILHNPDYEENDTLLRSVLQMNPIFREIPVQICRDGMSVSERIE
ncbi:MAG: hypothetical protein JXA19_00175 [Anaerolineales bacterium]|nr:hypothetical protein [Anaerolineales bacterium]